MDWYLEAFRKYAEFGGRSRRKEYWYFALFNMLATFSLAIADAVLGIGVLSIVYGLVVLIPGLAVSIRRLHDTGRSGWWLLIALVPVLGALALLFFTVQDSEPGPNQYGPNPKHGELAVAGGAALM